MDQKSDSRQIWVSFIWQKTTNKEIPWHGFQGGLVEHLYYLSLEISHKERIYITRVLARVFNLSLAQLLLSFTSITKRDYRLVIDRIDHGKKCDLIHSDDKTIIDTH